MDVAHGSFPVSLTRRAQQSFYQQSGGNASPFPPLGAGILCKKRPSGFRPEGLGVETLYLPAMDSSLTSTLGEAKAVMPVDLTSSSQATSVIFFKRS